MRNSLEQMELIDNFLDNKLSPLERATFTNDLLTDSALNEAVQQQLLLRHGIAQVGQREAIKKAKHAYQINLWTKWILAMLVIAALGIAVFSALLPKHGEHETAIPREMPNEEPISSFNTSAVDSQPQSDTTSTKPSTFSNGTSISFMESKPYDALSRVYAPIRQRTISNSCVEEGILDEQVFEIDAMRSNILTSEEGFVFAIAPGSFGSYTVVEVRIREAVTPEQIIYAGLSTESDGKLLETAGMFEFNAYSNGQLIPIEKAILVSKGSNQPAAEMLLFDGVKDETGKINWVNPQPLTNDLALRPINEMNFIPQKFTDNLLYMKPDISAKTRDSLYYSYRLTPNFSSAETETTTILRRLPEARIYPIDGSDTITILTPKPISYSYTSFNGLSGLTSGPFINPARIKTLYSKQFEPTLIATDAFEERLQFIHTTCDSSLLDLYIAHLDWPIYKIDSLAYDQCKKSEFLEFYKRKEGGVKLDSEAAQTLQSFYKNQYTVYNRALEETYKNDQALYQAIANEMNTSSQALSKTEQSAASRLFQEEVTNNYNAIARKMGYPERSTPRNGIGSTSSVTSLLSNQPSMRASLTTIIPAPRQFNLTGSFRTNGWKNLDAFSSGAATERVTSVFKDKTGKSVKLKYANCSVELKNAYGSELVRCYFKPQESNSYVSISAGEDGLYRYSLNELFSYDVICVGYTKGACYYAESKINGDENLKLELLSITKEELSIKLNALAKEEHDLFGALEAYSVATEKMNAYQKNLLINTTQREQLREYVFPCVTIADPPFFRETPEGTTNTLKEYPINFFPPR